MTQDKDEPGITRRAALEGIAAGVALGPAVLTPAAAAEAAPGEIVATAAGRIQGLRIDGIHQFRGVRYGASTAGAGRFASARPVEPWSGVRPATEYGPMAPQVVVPRPPHIAWYYAAAESSEDCLVLNVFTPSVNDPARRPVMVWIHGGGFSTGLGNAKGFDGTNLAKRGDVVVVTLNHRLNVFGHFYLGMPGGERFQDSGNNGSLDIIAALRWVRDNIAAFGGDPGNVTLFGQSGGASYITTLLAMPPAQGLFHKAILQSFSAGLTMGRPDTAAKAGELVLRHLGVGRGDIRAIEEAPVERVLAAMTATIKEVGADNFRAIVDGRSLPRDPFAPDAPSLSAGVPLIIGNVEHEATYALSTNPKNYAMTRSEAIDRTASFVGIDRAAAETLYDGFAARHPGRPIDAYIAIQSIHMYRRNDIRAAELKAEQGRAPVYLYLFTWKTPVLPEMLGAMHTLEVPFVFGNTGLVPEVAGSGPDLAPLSETMLRAWAGFARTGRPDLPAWRPFTLAGRETMVFDRTPRLESDPLADDRRAIEACPPYDPEARRI